MLDRALVGASLAGRWAKVAVAPCGASQFSTSSSDPLRRAPPPVHPGHFFCSPKPFGTLANGKRLWKHPAWLVSLQRSYTRGQRSRAAMLSCPLTPQSSHRFISLALPPESVTSTVILLEELCFSGGPSALFQALACYLARPLNIHSPAIKIP